MFQPENRETDQNRKTEPKNGSELFSGNRIIVPVRIPVPNNAWPQALYDIVSGVPVFAEKTI